MAHVILKQSEAVCSASTRSTETEPMQASLRGFLPSISVWGSKKHPVLRRINSKPALHQPQTPIEEL